MAAHALLSNKLRSFLSILGIIIGVSTVITVFGIGLGAQKQVEAQFKNLSVTTLVAFPMTSGNASSKLSDEDIDYVMREAETIISGTSMMRGNATVSGDDTEKSLSLLGVFPDFFSLSNLEVEVGNIFPKDDVLRRSKVVVLGSEAAKDLFEDYTPEEIRGETVNIAGKKFEVVAVLKSNGQNAGSMSMDDSIFVPYSTADKNILGEKGMTILMFHAKSVEDLGVAQLEVEALLRKNHNLRPSDDSDFRVRDPGSIVSSAQATSKTLTFLLTAVASIVLFVSGIGIMNVMFVTVAERTKEIGILKAIGAKQRDILLQFLMEAVILSILGGIIGILLGGAIIPLLKSFSAVYSLFSIFIGFSFSALVGIFFGFYPALKASRLDPVDALRSE